jgi:seryl-tRNA synthetase
VLDIRLLRDNLDLVREALRRRARLDTFAPMLERAEALERERRSIIRQTEERKSARNAASQEVARRKRIGESVDDLIASSRATGDAIARLEDELGHVQGELTGILLELPNIPLPDVPRGGEACSVVTREWGEPRPSNGVRPHWDIGAGLGIIDPEGGARVTGSGFLFYRGKGARLVRALLAYFVDLHADEHGYEEVWPPLLVNRGTMTGTGQLPKFEDDLYRTNDDLFLIPTAEVPVTNLYREQVIPEAALPMAFVAYSKCFRREAGSAGKDTRGVLRTHEFDKVELVRYTTPEASNEQLEILTAHAEKALEQLGLPYRRKLLAAGDTSFASAKTYDLEAWAPGVGAWLEVSSCSTFTDFQARRANIRYRPADGGKPRFIHTLNGSGLAFPRVLAAILEHYQRPDGTVTVPETLRPYVGADILA